MRKLTEEEENYIRENLKYDPETGYLWWTKPSGKRKLNKPVGSLGNGYLTFSLPTTSLVSNTRLFQRAHRVAWFLHYGVWPDELVDHINGIKTDNRIENLRLATHKENHRNRKSHKGSSSKYKGVTWSKRDSKWCSYIYYDKMKHLGSYTSEEEAARTYDKAARELYGEFACLNFPEGHEQGATHGPDV